MVDLTARPFFLNEDDMRWVRETIAAMTLEEKIGQLFINMGASRDEPVGRITLGLPPSVGRQLTLPLIDGFQRRLPRARLAIVEACPATSPNGSPRRGRPSKP